MQYIYHMIEGDLYIYILSCWTKWANQLLPRCLKVILFTLSVISCFSLSKNFDGDDLRYITRLTIIIFHFFQYITWLIYSTLFEH
jgi:hypothetical protein